MLAVAALSAQQPPPPIASPEVHPDRTITFRLRGPDVSKVVLRASWAGEPKPMTKGEDGVWSVKIGPVEPDILSYMYEIDGVVVVDPHNPRVKLWEGGASSLVEVPGDKPRFYDLQSVPHGDLHVHYYDSAAVDHARRLHVYTPPGYEESSDRTYPTFYLLHGAGDNDSTWSAVGQANLILDNLLAEGRVQPMVVVMTNGHPVPFAQRRALLGKNVGLYVQDLTESVIPLIESKYRVRRDRGSRAIAGLSMGGGQALQAGLGRLDLFSSIGAFSSAVIDPSENKVIQDLVANPEASNKKIGLLWIAIGKNDFLLERNQQFIALLNEKSIEHEYHLTEGDHSWPVWQRYLRDFAPRLFQP